MTSPADELRSARRSSRDLPMRCTGARQHHRRLHHGEALQRPVRQRQGDFHGSRREAFRAGGGRLQRREREPGAQRRVVERDGGKFLRRDPPLRGSDVGGAGGEPAPKGVGGVRLRKNGGEAQNPKGEGQMAKGKQRELHGRIVRFQPGKVKRAAGGLPLVPKQVGMARRAVRATERSVRWRNVTQSGAVYSSVPSPDAALPPSSDCGAMSLPNFATAPLRTQSPSGIPSRESSESRDGRATAHTSPRGAGGGACRRRRRAACPGTVRH